MNDVLIFRAEVFWVVKAVYYCGRIPTFQRSMLPGGAALDAVVKRKKKSQTLLGIEPRSSSP
jgi:hypothetical protein